MNINTVDIIVTVVLLAPLIYGAFRYYRRVRLEGGIADQIVSDLSESSRLAAEGAAEHSSTHA